MSKIVHPYSFRLGIIRGWKSRWFAFGDKYKEMLKGDVLLREFLAKRLRGYFVAGIDIERGSKFLRVIIKTSRPGMIIGRAGEGSQRLRNDILVFLKREKLVIPQEFKMDIEEVSSPEANASIVAQLVTEGLEKRMPFRRVLKQTLDKVMANREVKGAKIGLSGRLGGADMSRREEIKKGSIPLQTLRADIDFARERAHLPYGDIGVKVWIYKGQIFKEKNKKQ